MAGKRWGLAFRFDVLLLIQASNQALLFFAKRPGLESVSKIGTRMTRGDTRLHDKSIRDLTLFITDTKTVFQFLSNRTKLSSTR